MTTPSPTWRANAGQRLQELIAAFVAAHPGERIRLLPDEQLVGAPGADYRLQIDDYDLRLVLAHAPDGRPALAAPDLLALRVLLEANPGTVALVLVWSTPALDALPLSINRIRAIVEAPARLPALLALARPLAAVLEDVYMRQVRFWESGLGAAPAPPGQAPDARRLFAQCLARALDAERQRSYRVIERRLAAEQYPLEAEQTLLLDTLHAAVEGTPPGELAAQLAALPGSSSP